jgi:LmbE family N-acetylglucosaminyl deacetylase
MADRRILISLAHPDDESFGLGGLIAKYVQEGADVYYICATNGDVGTVDAELLAGYNSIAELRLAELAAASQILGFKQVFTFGYKDSGMMGSDTSNDPACLWQAPQEQVTRRVVEVMREVQPQVVITFNKYGGYGHPDHIAIQRATTAAFALAGDASYATGQAPYTPQKLYYTGIPKQLVQIFVMMMRLQGKDPRKGGRNGDLDMQAVIDNCEPNHTRVDIRGFLDAWDAAGACHISQGGGGMTKMFGPLRPYLVRYQALTRIYPAPKQHRVDEYDLFTNVLLDAPAAHKELV